MPASKFTRDQLSSSSKLDIGLPFYAGTIFLAIAIITDTSKPLHPFFGHQITAVTSLDMRNAAGVVACLFYLVALWKYDRAMQAGKKGSESDQLEKLRSVKHLFAHNGFTIVFKLSLPNATPGTPPDTASAVSKAENGLKKIIDQDPLIDKDTLSKYESVLHVKFVSISKAKQDPEDLDEDVLPIGKTY